jgi:hypothetical protein
MYTYVFILLYAILMLLLTYMMYEYQRAFRREMITYVEILCVFIYKSLIDFFYFNQDTNICIITMVQLTQISKLSDMCYKGNCSIICYRI